MYAIDGDFKNSGVAINFKVSFVNKTGEPFFEQNGWTTNFTENDEGRNEFRMIPHAVDTKNVDVVIEDEKVQIYYFIDGKLNFTSFYSFFLNFKFSESYKPEDSRFFQLDKLTGNLSLKLDLDRETVDNHEIRIISTNSAKYPTNRVSDNSLLTVVITVNDVNDNPPKFKQANYAVGVSETDNLAKVLLILEATDPDLNDIVTYYLMTESIVATGDNIDIIRETAFNVKRTNGELTLNFKVQPTMKGFFEFKVEARDSVDHKDEAAVKIYLVAEVNRVTFVFLNEVSAVKRIDLEKLVNVFSKAYEAECVIDDILGTEVNGAVQEKLTDVRVHFVKNNEALEANMIRL